MDKQLIKYLLGEATPGERARVDQWLSADSRNQERYEQIKAAWDTSRQSVPPVTPDPEEALQRLRQRLNTRGTVLRKIRPAVRPSRSEGITGIGSRRVLAAAALIGVLAIGAVVYVLTERTRAVASYKPGPISGGGSMPHAATSGETSSIARSFALPSFPAGWSTVGWHFVKATDSVRKITLLDGSVVTLNRGGQLALSKALQNNERVVGLQGEAFFSIAADRAHPFIVRVGDLNIQVLGTSFNVRQQGNGIEVIVETGAVRVSRGGDNMVLHSGEKIFAGGPGGRLSRSINDDPFYSYYLERPLVCDSVPMERVVEMLNKAYDAQIVIATDDIRSLPLTTVFRHEPLDRILTVLGATLDIQVVRQGQTIILK